MLAYPSLARRKYEAQYLCMKCGRAYPTSLTRHSLRYGWALLASLFTLPVVVCGAESPPSRSLGLVEAVRLMLEQDPNLSIEQARLRSSRGILLSTQGTFDPVLSTSWEESEIDTPLTETSSREQRLIGNSLGIVKRFRTGLSIEPELALLRTQDLTGAPGSVNFGTFSFTFRQPLLRGRGRTATAAPGALGGAPGGRRRAGPAADDLRARSRRGRPVLANQSRSAQPGDPPGERRSRPGAAGDDPQADRR